MYLQPMITSSPANALSIRTDNLAFAFETLVTLNYSTGIGILDPSESVARGRGEAGKVPKSLQKDNNVFTEIANCIPAFLP